MKTQSTLLRSASRVARCALLFAAVSAFAEAPSDQEGVQLWEGGPYWADRNVGAEEPWSAGYFFWWGDTLGYIWDNDHWASHDGSVTNFVFFWDAGLTLTTRKNTPELIKTGWVTPDGVLAPEHDAARVHWGRDWRMPTRQELLDLGYNKCDWSWTTTNGVTVCVVRGRGDYADASIILPLAGWADKARFDRRDHMGHLYASDPRNDGVPASWRLRYSQKERVVFFHWDRHIGNNVRPVRGGAEKPAGQGRMAGTERGEIMVKPAGRGCAPEEATVAAPVEEAPAQKGVRLWEGGPCWADRNVGATSPADPGYFFWWGDVIGAKRENGAWVATDGSNPKFSFWEEVIPTFAIDSDALRREGFITEENALSPEHDAVRAHWGDGWRMPTRQDLEDLCHKCDWIWSTNGVGGCVVRGRGDYASASIFLPLSGIAVERTRFSENEYGFCWSSNPYVDGPPTDCSWRLVLGKNGVGVDYCWDRMFGAPVRPVRVDAE